MTKKENRILYFITSNPILENISEIDIMVNAGFCIKSKHMNSLNNRTGNFFSEIHLIRHQNCLTQDGIRY